MSNVKIVNNLWFAMGEDFLEGDSVGAAPFFVSRELARDYLSSCREEGLKGSSVYKINCKKLLTFLKDRGTKA